jgi:Txe/YoeB family toxin of Txe-Axe toxin-antitoxin module
MRTSPNGKVIIGIDEEEMKNITSYIGQDDRHKDKFKDIIKIIFEGLPYRHLWKREKLNSDVNNMWAMRFFVGQENDRIYCQEKSEGGIKIFILCYLHLHKTSDELSDAEKTLLTNLSKYEYEFAK